MQTKPKITTISLLLDCLSSVTQILIRQITNAEMETTFPSQYEGMDGLHVIKENLRTAIKIIERCIDKIEKLATGGL